MALESHFDSLMQKGTIMINNVLSFVQWENQRFSRAGVKAELRKRNEVLQVLIAN